MMSETKHRSSQTLENLPDEILILVMSFLREKTTYTPTRNKPWKHLLSMSLVSRRMSRIATDPQLWSTFEIYGRNIEWALNIFRMKRMSTLHHIDFWLSPEHTSDQVRAVLEVYASRKEYKMDCFRSISKTDFRSIEPELVTKVVTNCKTAIIEKDSITNEQIQDILHELSKGKCTLKHLLCRDHIMTTAQYEAAGHYYEAPGEMFNFADPDLVANAFNCLESVEIANTSLTSRMSTTHIIAILTEIAQNQKNMKCFSYTLPTSSFGTNSYPSLRDLDITIAKKLTAMVKQGEVTINYILPRIREVADEAYRI